MIEEKVAQATGKIPSSLSSRGSVTRAALVNSERVCSAVCVCAPQGTQLGTSQVTTAEAVWRGVDLLFTPLTAVEGAVINFPLF